VRRDSSWRGRVGGPRRRSRAEGIRRPRRRGWGWARCRSCAARPRSPPAYTWGRSRSSTSPPQRAPPAIRIEIGWVGWGGGGVGVFVFPPVLRWRNWNWWGSEPSGPIIEWSPAAQPNTTRHAITQLILSRSAAAAGKWSRSTPSNPRLVSSPRHRAMPVRPRQRRPMYATLRRRLTSSSTANGWTR